MLLEFGVSTKRLRGSQKSKSVAEVVVLDRGIGDGEGEREGQEVMERRSEAWLAVTDGGWMNTTDTTQLLEPRHFNFALNFPRIYHHRSTIVIKDGNRFDDP